MTRILAVNLEGAAGGAERSLVLLVEQLQGQFSTIVACPGDSVLSRLLDSKGFCCHKLPRPPARAYSSPLSVGYWLRASLCLVRVVLRAKPDLIHANSLCAAVAAMPAALLTRKSLLLHCRDLGGPGLISRVVGRFCSKLIAVSGAVKDALLRQGVKAEKIEVVYNGIDRAVISTSNPSSGMSKTGNAGVSGRFTFGHVGQFVPWKNHFVFLEAACRVGQELPEARFVLVGDDVFGRDRHYKEAVVSFVRKSTIADRVDLAGWREDMEEVWSGIDCLVHTAAREPFGRVIIEAMAHGIPVIAAGACGPAEIIENGRTGILVRAGDVGAFSEAMLRVAQDGEFAERLGSSGYADAVSRFTAGVTAERIGRIYREVLGL
ncbi:MAG: glycosyltransferase family 4 protein [Phycisphaerales bacterium]|nr:MAG: glycosyltransferase family 4 protein [Phycisphaerales bacterium]